MEIEIGTDLWLKRNNKWNFFSVVKESKVIWTLEDTNGKQVTIAKESTDNKIKTGSMVFDHDINLTMETFVCASQ
jgi:hypothetical protein